MIRSIDVQVTAPVYPTEVTDRVIDAITTLFPDAEVEQHSGEVIATAHALETLSEALYDQKILDTARRQFLEGRQGDTFSFDLKKQPAFEGVVNFAVGQPDELGELHVRVRVNEPDIDAYIDHIAPATEDGQPPES
ncbi:MAG: RNA-binding domain-containing protein [Salinarchaeum sp.]